jgi:chromate reductase
MATAIGISGSLREGSYNTALLRAASELAPEGLEIEIVTLHGIPPFNADEEAEHFPKTARELKERIASADAVLISTPEYNTGIPGVAKNAFDWLSRPPKDIDRVWGDLPIALIGATPGRGGTRFSQMAWLPVIRYLHARLWTGGTLYLAGARNAFDESGGLRDDTIRELLSDYLAGFAAYCSEHPRAGRS